MMSWGFCFHELFVSFLFKAAFCSFLLFYMYMGVRIRMR